MKCDKNIKPFCFHRSTRKGNEVSEVVRFYEIFQLLPDGCDIRAKRKRIPYIKKSKLSIYVLLTLNSRKIQEAKSHSTAGQS